LDREGRRQWVEVYSDAINQLIAICSGAVVVIATFLGRFTRNAKWQPLAGVAVLCFLACLVCLVWVKFRVATAIQYQEKEEARGKFEPRDRRETRRFSTRLWVSVGLGLFLIAIASLALFAARNFF
jgi:hypothetical protein